MGSIPARCPHRCFHPEKKRDNRSKQSWQERGLLAQGDEGSRPDGLKMPEKNQREELSTSCEVLLGWNGDLNLGPEGSASKKARRAQWALDPKKDGRKVIQTWTVTCKRQLKNIEARTKKIKQQSMRAGWLGKTPDKAGGGKVQTRALNHAKSNVVNSMSDVL